MKAAEARPLTNNSTIDKRTKARASVPPELQRVYRHIKEKAEGAYSMVFVTGFPSNECMEMVEAELIVESYRVNQAYVMAESGLSISW